MTEITRSRQRVLSGLLALLFTVVTIRLHDEAQQVVLEIQRSPAWTWAALVLLTTALSALAFGVVKSLTRWLKKTALAAAWMVMALMMALSHVMLMSVHTEAVHFAQFGLLATLVFFATRHVPFTLVLVTVAGMVDEGYQYWGLHAGWGVYFDWNDVVLNAVAGGLGLLYILTVRPHIFTGGPARGVITRNAEILFLGLLTGVIVVGILTGVIALKPQSDMTGVLVLLDRGTPPTRFWLVGWWSKKFYHQMSMNSALGSLIVILPYYKWSLGRIAADARRTRFPEPRTDENPRTDV